MVFISLYDFLYHSISPTFFLKKFLPFGMNVILQTSIIILLPLLSSSMKWMFEEVYLKHNHKSKKTREQSVVFMYLQFNWPCWNFENEKWDILEKKKKVDDLRIPHQKRAWKSIKQLFLFLTTYSGDQTLCTWKSENMKKKCN